MFLTDILPWLFPAPTLGSVTNWHSVESIPIKSAVFCADCENVTTTRNGCAVCGSHAIQSVENLIRREADNGSMENRRSSISAEKGQAAEDEARQAHQFYEMDTRP